MNAKLEESVARIVGENVKIGNFFKIMVENNASDLHITVGSPPALRINGSIIRIKMNPLTKEDTKNLIYQVLTEKQRSIFKEKKELDFSFEVKDLSRFRGNIFYSRGAMAASFRLIPSIIPDFKILNLPNSLLDIMEIKNGLILVTGETGSGKSTTLASILDFMNTHKNCHIVTIEDPIEFIHHHKNGIINQREIGRDTDDYKNALKSLLRQDPDVVLIGELRDPETISAALTMAETGHIVFGTLHTNSCVQTLTRIINAFPGHQRGQISTLLSFVLQGVVSQQLIPKSFEPGRILAIELLVPNMAIRNLIREDKIHQVYSQMQIGQEHSGMSTMNQSLEKLVANGTIDIKTALAHSTLPEELIKKIGVKNNLKG